MLKTPYNVCTVVKNEKNKVHCPLQNNPSKHPLVLLPMEIRYAELKAMVDFMYTGQVCGKGGGQEWGVWGVGITH